MSEENKRVVRELCKAVWDAANPEAAEEYFAEDMRITMHCRAWRPGSRVRKSMQPLGK